MPRLLADPGKDGQRRRGGCQANPAAWRRLPQCAHQAALQALLLSLPALHSRNVSANSAGIAVMPPTIGCVRLLRRVTMRFEWETRREPLLSSRANEIADAV